MKDEDIEKLLRSLPRQKATDEFTARLLAKLKDRTEGSSSPVPRSWLAPKPLLAWMAALVLIGAVVTGLQSWFELRERAEAARRVEALRNEYEALEKELEELRSLASASQPVVELGGSEEVDILLDLRTFTPANERDPQAQPVGYRR